MTTDFSLRAAPVARCPMCRSLLIGASGTHEFQTFPSKHVRFELFGDGFEHDVTIFPPAAVQQFTATFAPCGCQWQARDKAGLRLFILYIIHTDAGPTFEFGHRNHTNQYALYVMTTERTKTKMTYEDEDAYVCTSCGTIVDNPADMEKHKHGKDER